MGVGGLCQMTDLTQILVFYWLYQHLELGNFYGKGTHSVQEFQKFSEMMHNMWLLVSCFSLHSSLCAILKRDRSQSMYYSFHF